MGVLHRRTKEEGPELAGRTTTGSGFPIRPKDLRYVKLGTGGEWERECLEKGIVRYGFTAANAERFALCRAGRWDQLAESFVAEGKDKATTTRFTNETRFFFEDPGRRWITFVGERLCWGFSA
jgi:hypothetical protein